MNFEFATAARVIFGKGRLSEIGGIARSLGNRALLVTGRGSERAARLVDLLKRDRVETTLFQVSGEPKVQDVERGSELAKADRCDLVVGFGGGSALDAAKAIAALLANEGALLDYLEVIGRAKALERPAAPWIAVPTTAGTGAEVTRNSVLASPEHRFKVSLRSPFLLPRVALVDPELTYGLPPDLTATTGLDALTQLIEPYVSARANPLTDGFCIEGVRRVARSLQRAYSNGQDVQAREDMALASLFSGLALANASLGAVHGFAAPLGGMFAGPHGAFCAAVLPHASAVNMRALRQRQPEGEALQRYRQIARLLTDNPRADETDGVKYLQELCASLSTRPLRTFGVRQVDFPELIEKASKASSMKGNPVPLTADEMREILELAW